MTTQLSQLSQLPLPDKARKLAAMVSRGVVIQDAIEILDVDPHEAYAWVTHPSWEELVTLRAPVEKYVEQRVTGMVEQALNVKEDILVNDDVSRSLRNSVASEVLGSFGLGSVRPSGNVIVMNLSAEEIQLHQQILSELGGMDYVSNEGGKRVERSDHAEPHADVQGPPPTREWSDCIPDDQDGNDGFDGEAVRAVEVRRSDRRRDK